VNPTPWTKLVTAIHASDRQAVIAVTGGASKAISQLLKIPGASSTVLEAVVPYSLPALELWLGGTPDQACSERTARAMAMSSWMRAKELAPAADQYTLIGVGATASLASNRPKLGDHRVHVAVQTANATTSATLVLVKGHRDRKKEEWLAAKLLLVLLGEACGVEISTGTTALEAQLTHDEPLERRQQAAEAEWRELLLGERKIFATPNSDTGDDVPVQIVFPGAFNPPHTAHQRIADVASRRLNQKVFFELSITNVDKLPLDFIEIGERLDSLRQVSEGAHVLLTDAPTFRVKSALFPGCTFLVGTDTLQRIANPHYYDGNQAAYDEAVTQIAQRGCRFLVFGREVEGKFLVLSDLSIPPALAQLCSEVPATEFREDISSTYLRQQD